MMMTYLFYKTDYLYRSFFHKTFFYFTEKHYLCALKKTITLFITKIVTEYKLKNKYRNEKRYSS